MDLVDDAFVVAAAADLADDVVTVCTVLTSDGDSAIDDAFAAVDVTGDETEAEAIVGA